MCTYSIANNFSAVKSWGGGQNTMDSSVTEGEGRKRARSQWDEDLDRGKVGLLTCFGREPVREVGDVWDN